MEPDTVIVPVKSAHCERHDLSNRHIQKSSCSDHVAAALPDKAQVNNHDGRFQYEFDEKAVFLKCLFTSVWERVRSKSQTTTAQRLSQKHAPDTDLHASLVCRVCL